MAGMTEHEIAKRLKELGESVTLEDVRRVLSLTMSIVQQAGLRELRLMEIRLCDEMQDSILSRARTGHLGAIDRLLKIMERRAKYVPFLEVDQSLIRSQSTSTGSADDKVALSEILGLDPAALPDESNKT